MCVCGRGMYAVGDSVITETLLIAGIHNLAMQPTHTHVHGIDRFHLEKVLSLQHSDELAPRSITLRLEAVQRYSQKI